MCVVAYVSGHGFGHAAREIEILRHLPVDIPLIVKTRSAEWFWRSALGRSFDLIADSFDIGCIQHDSIRIDIPATFHAYAEIAATNRTRFADEVAFLQRVGARVVVSDVACFPLAVAAAADIPGICVCNFTWADIYADFVEEEPRFAPLIEEMLDQYRTTTLALDTELSLPMPYWPRKESVGLIAHPGRSRREELLSLLPPPAQNRRIALIYLGNWGFPLDYTRLDAFTDWQFVSYEAPPISVANWTVLERTPDWAHSDLTASVDLVVSKPGYGIVGECLSSGTPFLYPPRPEFAEYPALDAALQAWPGGLRIDRDRFLALDWSDTLTNIPPRGTLPHLPADGGPRAAERIAAIFQKGIL